MKRCSTSLVIRSKITGNNPNIINSRKDKEIGYKIVGANIEQKSEVAEEYMQYD